MHVQTSIKSDAEDKHFRCTFDDTVYDTAPTAVTLDLIYGDDSLTLSMSKADAIYLARLLFNTLFPD